MRTLPACLATLAALALAKVGRASECEFRAARTGAIETSGVQKVVIRVGAGDLKVHGREGSRIEARGEACASTQELLEATRIWVRREGATAFIETAIPDEKLREMRGNPYAYIDIQITLPANLPVEAQDSSGDADLADLASLVMRDSSGDLEIERIKGALTLQDSSGEIHVREVASVKLEDSSGDATIEKVSGAVEIVSDSSGDLIVRNIGGGVDVRQDSSGDIRTEDVRGNVRVGVDSSGSIYARNVSGDFTVESDSSGDISHDGVKGRVSMPEHK
jgi:hypothetical protein